MKYLEGKVSIPEASDRWKALEAQEEGLKVYNFPPRHSLIMGPAGMDLYPYLEELAKEGNFEEYSKNLPLKRKCFYIDLGRVFAAVSQFKRDRVRWVDDYNVEYYCYGEPGDDPPEEYLKVSQDPETRVVSITSSLGQVHNGPFFNLWALM